jgi:hypothetical protein
MYGESLNQPGATMIYADAWGFHHWRITAEKVLIKSLTRRHHQVPCASISSVVIFSNLVSIARWDLRHCFFAPTGKRFTAWQRRQVTTSTSAQGFLPPRLLFSTWTDEVLPGIKIASHRLQMECFKVGESRIWPLRETERRWEIKWQLGPNVSFNPDSGEWCSREDKISASSMRISRVSSFGGTVWGLGSQWAGSLVVCSPRSRRAFMR